MPARCAGRLAVLAAFAALASISSPAGATGDDDVWLPFNGPTGVAVTINNAGTASTVQRVVATNGGSISFAPSYTGARNAADFPAYGGAADDPRAVVAVTNAGPVDELVPSGRPFSFGADVRLDGTNAGTYYDNGNNVIQRGLYNETSQFKIQVDHGQASCRVRGPGGATLLVSGRAMVTGAWFQLRCSRTSVPGPDRFAFSVRSIRSDGTLGAATTVTSLAAVGKLSYPVATPLSVGGKLTSDGSVVDASDQFNGKIDNAFFRID
ncbi:hypothetical protein [Nocardioides sp.]|uniref:hypothetical protein n=1 Tax=Nocardioides sp. TaxID=35761 RepID=UPI003D0E18EC